MQKRRGVRVIDPARHKGFELLDLLVGDPSGADAQGFADAFAEQIADTGFGFTDPVGPRATVARDRWVARMATSHEAGILELPPGAPVAHVIHSAEAADGTILEISESIWPADRVMILDEYPITAEPETPAAESEV